MWYWKAKHFLGDSHVYGPFPAHWLARLHRWWTERRTPRGYWSTFSPPYLARKGWVH